MRKFKYLFYFSVAAFIIAGILFVKVTRYNNAVSTVETIKDKVIVVYSSNFKRMYDRSSNSYVKDMGMLCMEAVSLLKGGNLNSVYIRIQEGNEDPYTSSGVQLNKSLSKNYKYVLIDINRGQSKHGDKYMIGDKACCAITMILSRKSKSYDDTLLLAGRIKESIDKKYESLPVKIETTDDGDYNQSMGSMGMLLELGDAANKYDEARESLGIFCRALIEVVDAER